jgi:hypothetical protein
MADTLSRHRPTSHHAQAGFTLAAEVLPAASAQPYALRDALRLLATWAVRAARSRIAEPTSRQRRGSPDQPHDPTQEENQ